MAYDPFQPRNEPARTIYEAFQAEAKLRRRRTVDEWIAAERNAVLNAAQSYAASHRVHAPTAEQIHTAERNAVGHVDYGAKWAYGVAELMKPLGFSSRV